MTTTYRVNPLLVYEDIAAAHDFLVDAFGFEPGHVYRDDDGNAVHGEVKVGEVTIWLHAVNPEHGMRSPRGSSSSPGGLVIHVEDVDAHCERARAAGATIDSEPKDQSYGMREYGARDPEGHRWWFGSPN